MIMPKSVVLDVVRRWRGPRSDELELQALFPARHPGCDPLFYPGLRAAPHPSILAPPGGSACPPSPPTPRRVGELRPDPAPLPPGAVGEELRSALPRPRATRAVPGATGGPAKGCHPALPAPASYSVPTPA